MKLNKKQTKLFWKEYIKMFDMLTIEMNKQESRKDRWNRITRLAGKSDFI